MNTVNFDLIPFVFDINNNVSAAGKTPNVSITGNLNVTDTHVDIVYRLTGSTETIRFSTPKEKGHRQDGLWNTTCFEMFIQEGGQPDYWEYNLATSGDWNLFRFSGYRENKVDENSIEHIPVHASFNESGLKSLSATLPLPAPLRCKKHKIGISCVLETANHQLFYYALTHGKAQPDFHDKTSFLLST